MLKLWFDNQHLLSYELEEDNYSKSYSYSFSWCRIVSEDKWMLVYNKRQWRTIHFKEISEWMQVCYLQENPVGNVKLSVEMLENALAIFQWFNEETWEKYHYLPFYSKNVERLEKDFDVFFWIKVKISKEPQWTFVRWIKSKYVFPGGLSCILSFIFALVCIYWRFDEKNWELSAIRAFIPIVWWTYINEELDSAFEKLGKEYWIFIASQKVQNWNKLIYQFASNDKELLSLCVDWINMYSKASQPKLDNYLKKQNEIKSQLIEFIKWESEFDKELNSEVLKKIDQYDVKFIKCL